MSAADLSNVHNLPLVLRHWPTDARDRGTLPSCAGVLIWRPARSTLFWIQTDADGGIEEVWPLIYACTEAQVREQARWRPCFLYREPDGPPLKTPANRAGRRRRRTT